MTTKHPSGPSISFEETRVAGLGQGYDGTLVFADGELIAVLSLLDDQELYGEEDGCLFLEAGFGKLADQHRTFQDQGEVGRWLISQLT